MKKKHLYIIAAVILLFLAGHFIPVAGYTTTQGCPIAPSDKRTVSHRLILGDTLEEAKNSDVQLNPNQGCAPETEHLLFLI